MMGIVEVVERERERDELLDFNETKDMRGPINKEMICHFIDNDCIYVMSINIFFNFCV